MPSSRPLRFLGALAVIVAATGCSALIPGPEPLVGGRHWIITIDNQSAQPASLLVAVDGAPGPNTNIGPTVGRVTPSTVAPHAVMDVTFEVPSGDFKATTGDTWAIFVNPGRPGEGPLILGTDVPPDVVGKLPITIFIQRDGSPATEIPGDVPPGWFGN